MTVEQWKTLRERLGIDNLPDSNQLCDEFIMYMLELTNVIVPQFIKNSLKEKGHTFKHLFEFWLKECYCNPVSIDTNFESIKKLFCVDAPATPSFPGIQLTYNQVISKYKTCFLGFIDHFILCIIDVRERSIFFEEDYKEIAEATWLNSSLKNLLEIWLKIIPDIEPSNIKEHCHIFLKRMAELELLCGSLYHHGDIINLARKVARYAGEMLSSDLLVTNGWKQTDVRHLVEAMLVEIRDKNRAKDVAESFARGILQGILKIENKGYFPIVSHLLRTYRPDNKD